MLELFLVEIHSKVMHVSLQEMFLELYVLDSVKVFQSQVFPLDITHILYMTVSLTSLSFPQA